MSSTSTIKKLVLVFDLICALLALVLIAFGVYLFLTYEPSGWGYFDAWGYIGIGAAGLLILFMGCVGALRENVCCTITFIVFLHIIILLQLAATVFMTEGRGVVSSYLAGAVDKAWEAELNSAGAMSHYESWFECCGRASPQDYIVNEQMPPKTCFRNGDNSRSENLNMSGCRIAFENYIDKLLLIFNIIAWVLIALEFIGGIISCCLCNSIRNNQRRSYF